MGFVRPQLTFDERAKLPQVLRNDKRAIFTAASKAKEAATYLQELTGIPVPRAA